MTRILLDAGAAGGRYAAALRVSKMKHFFKTPEDGVTGAGNKKVLQIATTANGQTKEGRNKKIYKNNLLATRIRLAQPLLYL